MAFLVEDLINGAKRRGYIPISQSTEDSDSLIDRLNDELSLTIVPAIESVKENYWLTWERVAITANKSLYNIPARASGTALKDIWVLDNAYNRMRPLPRVDVHNFSIMNTPSNSVIEGLLIGDQVQIRPTPSNTTGYLEFWYYQRPNTLIATSSCAKITAVSTVSGTTTFTVDTDLTASLSIGSLVDFINGQTPFSSQGDNVAILAISSTEIQVTATYIEDETGTVVPGVGDYICPAGFSCIAQIPQEFYPVLAQATAVAYLESSGDLQKQQVAAGTLGRMMQAALKLISNRLEGEPEVIFNRDGVCSAIGNAVYGYQSVWR